MPEAGEKFGLLVRGLSGAETPGGLGRGYSPDKCNTRWVRGPRCLRSEGEGNHIQWGCGVTVLKEEVLGHSTGWGLSPKREAEVRRRWVRKV